MSSCALSADGRQALSASEDRTLRVWDVASGTTLQVLEGHTSSVLSCALNGDGRLAISVSWDQTLRLWDVANGTILRMLEGHTGSVIGLCIEWGWSSGPQCVIGPGRYGCGM